VTADVLATRSDDKAMSQQMNRVKIEPRSVKWQRGTTIEGTG
jgi:hypothetical protein